MKILAFVLNFISIMCICFGMYLIGQMYMEYGEDVRPIIFVLIWVIGDGLSALSEYFRKKAVK